MRKLPISAIVVGLNEEALLTGCLLPLDFCDELLFVDLGSKDSSREVALKLGARVVSHSWVPIGEFVVAELYRLVKHDWILFLDPDEHIDEWLKPDILSQLPEILSRADVGSVSVPSQFHFKGRPLFGTPWGGRRTRVFLAHRRRFSFTAEVHRGRKLRAGFQSVEVTSNGLLNHFWSNSWVALTKKHLRYLTLEGASRHARGDRISIGGIAVAIFPTLIRTFRTYFNRADGWTGIALCAFWASYKIGSLVSLFLVQMFGRRA